MDHSSFWESKNTVAKYGDLPSIGKDAVDLHVRTAEHKVAMLLGLIGAGGLQLFAVHRRPTLDIFRVRRAQRKMAGGVFIEQGCQE